MKVVEALAAILQLAVTVNLFVSALRYRQGDLGGLPYRRAWALFLFVPTPIRGMEFCFRVHPMMRTSEWAKLAD
ncbi:MAG: hypothetical protein ACR2JC_11160 [Chloroflexota bacterium]|nr:MAG: hypothetical protein DLM70_09550 [Chloroflexota bacterium]